MIDQIRIFLPPVPSVNHIYSTNRWGRRFLTREGKEWKKAAGLVATYERLVQKWPYSIGEKLVMELRFYWPDRRKRDCDNSLKLIQDAFTKILYDDDKWVLSRVMDWQLDKEEPRVEVRLFKLSSESA